jgi:hypothetical protein
VRIFPVQSRVYRLRRRFAPLTEREKYDENALIEKWLALNTQSAKGMLKLPITQTLLV